MTRKTLGAQLKAARMKLDLTQADLSDKLGYTSPQFVSNIERGITSFPEGNVKKYARAVKMEPAKLLTMIYTAKHAAAMKKYL